MILLGLLCKVLILFGVKMAINFCQQVLEKPLGSYTRLFTIYAIKCLEEYEVKIDHRSYTQLEQL